MRIDPNVVVFPVPSATSGETTKPRQSAPSGDATVVKLSANATAASGSSEGVHDARLERIRSLIDRGEYPIDLELLTSRIVDDDILRGS